MIRIVEDKSTFSDFINNMDQLFQEGKAIADRALEEQIVIDQFNILSEKGLILEEEKEMLLKMIKSDDKENLTVARSILQVKIGEYYKKHNYGNIL